MPDVRDLQVLTRRFESMLLGLSSPLIKQGFRLLSGDTVLSLKTFLQLIFIEQLLCARHCLRHSRYSWGANAVFHCSVDAPPSLFPPFPVVTTAKLTWNRCVLCFPLR